jgi:hypothetical protein
VLRFSCLLTRENWPKTEIKKFEKEVILELFIRQK